MKSLKDIISERLKADSVADVPVSNEESADVQADFDNVDNKKISSDVTKVKESENENIVAAFVEKPPADDVPIYTATAKEIHYWHSCVNIHVLDFLRTYDLDRQSVAFNSFCVGVDDAKHALTFAIDDLRDLPLDENARYLKIDLNDTNVRPIDKEQAEKVLRVVNARRFEQVKFNPCYRARTW